MASAGVHGDVFGSSSNLIKQGWGGMFTELTCLGLVLLPLRFFKTQDSR
jgi:hypothetical protein